MPFIDCVLNRLVNIIFSDYLFITSDPCSTTDDDQIQVIVATVTRTRLTAIAIKPSYLSTNDSRVSSVQCYSGVAIEVVPISEEYPNFAVVRVSIRFILLLERKICQATNL